LHKYKKALDRLIQRLRFLGRSVGDAWVGWVDAEGGGEGDIEHNTLS